MKLGLTNHDSLFLVDDEYRGTGAFRYVEVRHTQILSQDLRIWVKGNGTVIFMIAANKISMSSYVIYDDDRICEGLGFDHHRAKKLVVLTEIVWQTLLPLPNVVKLVLKEGCMSDADMAALCVACPKLRKVRIQASGPRFVFLPHSCLVDIRIWGASCVDADALGKIEKIGGDIEFLSVHKAIKAQAGIIYCRYVYHPTCRALIGECDPDDNDADSFYGSLNEYLCDYDVEYLPESLENDDSE